MKYVDVPIYTPIYHIIKYSMKRMKNMTQNRHIYSRIPFTKN